MVAAESGRVWVLWSIAAALASVAYFALLREPSRSLLYDGVAFAAAGAVVVGVRRYRPAAAAAWYLLAGGVALWAVGDSIWTAHDLRSDDPVPFPSAADVVYLLGYVALGAGIGLLCRVRGITRRTVQDSLALGLAAGAVSIAPLVVDVLAADAGPVAELIAVAYPVMTWALLLAVVGLGMSGGFRRPAEMILAAGLVAQLAADVVYGHQGVDGSYVSGSAVDAGWLAFYAAVGAAALHSSMVDVGVPQRRADELTLPRLAIVVGGLVVLFVGERAWGEVSRLLVTPFWVVVFALVVWRLADLVGGLSRAALRDDLTGLPNRASLNDRLELALATARRRGGVVGVLFCDVDHFKLVNDSLGHTAGDALLRGIADRLNESVRGSDTVARLGGDEFVVLVADASDTDEVEAVAERIHAALEQPIELADGSEFFVTVSIGVRIAEGDVDSGVDEMLRDADAAMYVAKDRGRNRFARFHAGLHEHATKRLNLANDLRRAIVAGELGVHYQPEIDLATGTLFGFEALARWHHDAIGYVSPAEFISVAEEAGLIDDVFGWVLAEVLRQQSVWRTELGWVPQVAVNASPQQLGDRDLPGLVRDALAVCGGAPDDLWIELTESAFADDDALVTVRSLRDLGVRIAVDDFGTGYSSLALLRRMPVDVIKIDRAFTACLGDPADDRLVEAVIRVGHSLGAQTVAEGVETRAQLETLKRLDCDIAQGWLLSKAVPGGDALVDIGAAARWIGPAADLLGDPTTQR